MMRLQKPSGTRFRIGDFFGREIDVNLLTSSCRHKVIFAEIFWIASSLGHESYLMRRLQPALPFFGDPVGGGGGRGDSRNEKAISDK